MASPWGKPRNWDLGSQNLIHRGTGISSFVGKGSGLRSGERKQTPRKTPTYGPADWKNSSSASPSSHYGTLPRRSTSQAPNRPSVMTMSPGTRAILSLSSSSKTDHRSGSKIPQLSRSKSSHTISQSHQSRQGLSRSSSSTFTPSQSDKHLASQDHSTSQRKLRKSYSSATLPRNTRLYREEAENVIRRGDKLKRTSSSPLKRSASNDFSSRSPAPVASFSRSMIPDKDYKDPIEDAVTRSRAARAKHRERPDNILQTKKSTRPRPPVSINNMNVRANQVIRSSSNSALQATVKKGLHRSKSTGGMNDYYGNSSSQKTSLSRRHSWGTSDSDSEPHESQAYYNNPNYTSPRSQDPPPLRRAGEHESLREDLFGKDDRQVRSSREMRVQRKPRDTRSEMTRDWGTRKIEAPNQRKNSSRRKDREPYVFHNLSQKFKVDSEDGLDDTLFDCTQLSSESEFELMKPEEGVFIAAKPSFQEIRDGIRSRYPGDIKFPRSRSMSSGRRQCLVQLHQITFNLERPPTLRELSDYYKDPMMIPNFQNYTSKNSRSSSMIKAKPKKGDRRRAFSASNKYQAFDRYSVTSSSSDESSLISFSEYERRLRANNASYHSHTESRTLPRMNRANTESNTLPRINRAHTESNTLPRMNPSDSLKTKRLEDHMSAAFPEIKTKRTISYEFESPGILQDHPSNMSLDLDSPVQPEIISPVFQEMNHESYSAPKSNVKTKRSSASSYESESPINTPQKCTSKTSFSLDSPLEPDYTNTHLKTNHEFNVPQPKAKRKISYEPELSTEPSSNSSSRSSPNIDLDAIPKVQVDAGTISLEESVPIAPEHSKDPLNEDDVIAELQHIIEQELIETDNENAASSYGRESHVEPMNIENVSPHEKLLSDQDINSDIKLLSNSSSDDIDSLSNFVSNKFSRLKSSYIDGNFDDKIQTSDQKDALEAKCLPSDTENAADIEGTEGTGAVDHVVPEKSSQTKLKEVSTKSITLHCEVDETESTESSLSLASVSSERQNDPEQINYKKSHNDHNVAATCVLHGDARTPYADRCYNDRGGQRLTNCIQRSHHYEQQNSMDSNSSSSSEPKLIERYRPVVAEKTMALKEKSADHDDKSSLFNYGDYMSNIRPAKFEADEMSNSNSSVLVSSEKTASSESEEISDQPQVSIPPYKRPGSPLSKIRPIRTSFSANTLAYLQNKRLSSAAPPKGVESKAGSITLPLGSNESLILTKNPRRSSSSDASETMKPSTDSSPQALSSPLQDGTEFALTELSPGAVPKPLQDKSPEVIDTSGTLPDQRPYYKTVVIDPFSPDSTTSTASSEQDTSTSESVSDSFSVTISLSKTSE